MRQEFFYELEKLMAKNKRVYSLTGDLGFPFFKTIEQRFPDRYFNVGAAEQAGTDVCVGLALSGKIPFFYSITPFAILRPFETLRTYINHEKIPVKIVGSGSGMDYKLDGFSTCAPDIDEILKPLKNIQIFKPKTEAELPALLKKVVSMPLPCVIIIQRKERLNTPWHKS